jgi:2,3-bisphosphoglycerate-dependent phosphoglycerate mutase
MDSLILVRHGESIFSERDAMNGDPAVAGPLTPVGIDEARGLGAELADEPIELCVTSRFGRTRQTADLVLAGRDVPRIVMAEFDDPNYGAFEGASLEDYRSWAASSPSGIGAPGGGESRHAIVARYTRGLQALIDRDEGVVLLVAHSLPIAYALAAREGDVPAPRVPLVEHARAHRLSREELAAVVALLEDWCAAPTW